VGTLTNVATGPRQSEGTGPVPKVCKLQLGRGLKIGTVVRETRWFECGVEKQGNVSGGGDDEARCRWRNSSTCKVIVGSVGIHGEANRWKTNRA
jgi:hypothetical protein